MNEFRANMRLLVPAQVDPCSYFIQHLRVRHRGITGPYLSCILSSKEPVGKEKKKLMGSFCCL